MTELAPAPGERADSDAIGIAPVRHWIDGPSWPGRRAARAPCSTRPRAGRPARCDLASVEEVDSAVQSAEAAFASWRTVSLAKRAELLFAIRELVHERKPDIAKHPRRRARQGALATPWAR